MDGVAIRSVTVTVVEPVVDVGVVKDAGAECAVTVPDDPNAVDVSHVTVAEFATVPGFVAQEHEYSTEAEAGLAAIVPMLPPLVRVQPGRFSTTFTPLTG